MSRRTIAALALAGLALVIGLDVTASPPNPYHAPALFALGSGAAPGGGFCGALPD
ncbi:hypothetical protein [Pelagivirga sediminicola]|uniref:hypothetical protein n=1 Tax=Pelagivirga sediminicola TaxID=2170575 RepID=UPI00140283BB|nr:hypothetical protein [Pelagivirga sediminicola]